MRSASMTVLSRWAIATRVVPLSREWMLWLTCAGSRLSRAARGLVEQEDPGTGQPSARAMDQPLVHAGRS